jgi:hypothetical protein
MEDAPEDRDPVVEAYKPVVEAYKKDIDRTLIAERT